MDVPTPPAFAPIAVLLLPDSYKSDLTRIIRTAPENFLDDRDWWAQVRAATGAKWADLKKVHANATQAAGRPRANVLDMLKKYIELPIVQQDPTAKKMLQTFGSRASSGKASLESIMKMQETISARLQRTHDKLKQKETALERLKRSQKGPSNPKTSKQPTGTAESTEAKGKPISEDVVIEGLMSDVVSKMTAFFASPQLSKIMVGEYTTKKQARNLAKAAVYSLFQIISDRAYDTLQKGGLDRRMMMTAFKNRNEPGNAGIMDKAAELLGSKKRFSQPKKVVPPKVAPAQEKPIDAKLVDDPDIKFGDVQTKEAVQEDGMDNKMNNVKSEKTKPEPPISTGTMIYRKMKSAARAAKAAGQDPVAMADYVLMRYEEAKVPEAAIVRRMFDRSKAN